MVVQQCWTSDQPGQEGVHRLASRALLPGEREVLATQSFPETAAAIGPTLGKLFNPINGHVVLRVDPGGGAYELLVLDDRDETASFPWSKHLMSRTA